MTGVVEIPLTRGQVTIIDAADFERVARHRWHTKIKRSQPGRYYAQSTVRLPPERGGRWTSVQLHRFILDAQPGQVIDHVNGSGLDNRRANLRITDVRGNSTNVTSSKNQKRGGWKGVNWHKGAAKWAATICAGEVKPNGKRRQLHLGLFTDPVAAAHAYDAAALKHFGEFASLNFPETGIAAGLAAALAGDEAATHAALAATAEALGFTAGGAS